MSRPGIFFSISDFSLHKIGQVFPQGLWGRDMATQLTPASCSRTVIRSASNSCTTFSVNSEWLRVEGQKARMPGAGSLQG